MKMLIIPDDEVGIGLKVIPEIDMVDPETETANFHVAN